MARQKSDTPPFQMVIEKGPRLAPATASDAERLDTWRVGSRVNVSFVRNGSRVMERKWWAVLGLVVDRCNVPWTTKEQASEAIKLALDITNMTKTVGGAWMLYPKSLTELDDAELDKAVSRMMDLITEMTGIDPETLRREAADVGQDETEQPEAPVNPASGSGSGEVSSPTSGPAPDLSEIASPAGETIQSGQDEAMESAPATEDPSVGADSHQSARAADQEEGSSPVAPASEPPSDAGAFKKLLMEECVENILRDAFSEPKDQQTEKVNKLERIFLEPQNLGSHPEFVRRCAETARRIIGKPQEKPRARDYLMGLVR